MKFSNVKQLDWQKWKTPLTSAWMGGWVLLTLLGGIYFLTYRGFPNSLDELSLLGATESLTKYGDLRLVSLYHEHLLGGNPLVINRLPWQQTLQEPVQIILATPLYQLGLETPLGLLHTVWLFNLGVGLTLALVFYLGGLSLGYSPLVSLSATICLSLGTMLWHFSQTFFREPLASLWLYLTVLLAMHLHQRWRWGLALLMAVSFLAAGQTKIVSLTLLPTLGLLLFPQLDWHITRRQQRGLAVATLMILGAGLLLLIFANLSNPSFSYRGRVLSFDWDYISTVLGAYGFSVGRSLWGTSPILLLSFYGAWSWYRVGQMRWAVAPFLAFMTLVLNYAISGRDWHGGRGWGSRYLVPIIPIMGSLLLPALQQVVLSRYTWLKAATFGLFCLSVMVQLSGVLVPIEPYYAHIQEAFPDDTLGGLYGESTWNPRYTQAYIQWENLPHYPLDVAWTYTDHAERGYLVGGLLLGLALVGGWFYARRGLSQGSGAILIALTSGMMLVGYPWAISGLEDDRRFAPRPELVQMVDYLQQNAQADDFIVLTDPSYRDFFLNVYKGQARWATMPHAVGERYSFEQVPLVETTNPNERLQWQILLPLEYLVSRHQTIWLVSNLGSFHPWAYRPIEHYFARHFYPVQSLELAADVRLLRYSTVPAPAYDDRYQTLYIPEQEPYQFGENLLLRGYDFLPDIQRGQVLPVSLWWEAQNTIPFDYNVGVQLFNEAGQLAAQHDGQPQGSFGYMSQWANDVPQGDNHGLIIPPDLPPGRYTLKVVVYDWRDGTRLRVQRQNQMTEDDAALLGTISIKP